MPDTLIRLCYRKLIDANSQMQWDKEVWEDMYGEFRMQSQTYNGEKKYKLYSEMAKNIKRAEQLPHLVSTTLIGYLKQLNDIMPDVLNVSGNPYLPFKNYKFDIIESDITNKAAHKIAIGFISEPLLWHETINGMLLISLPENTDANDGAALTEMITLQSFLTIFSLKKETE